MACGRDSLIVMPLSAGDIRALGRHLAVSELGAVIHVILIAAICHKAT